MNITTDGNVLENVYDIYTGEYVNYYKTTVYIDGANMDDTKCDGVMYRKYQNTYWRRFFNGAVNVDSWGAKGDAVIDFTTNTVTSGTDDTVAFTAALIFCGKAKCKLTLTAGKKYIVEGLNPPGYSTIEGSAGGFNRFGPNASPDGSVWLVHKTGSIVPCINMANPTVTLKNLYIYGNNNSASTLRILNGFESHLDNIRVAYCNGTGLEITGAYNIYYNKVFVDNCGTATLPAVSLNCLSPRTINTLNWNGLTIERSKNVALIVGSGVAATKGYPEMLYIVGLHVEAPNDNGGVPNVDALVRFENFRNVTLVSPFIYGGPGYIVEHIQTEPASIGVYGGLSIQGGTILGRDSATGYQPTNLIHLVSGDGFTMNGTVLDNCSGPFVVVESTYGPNVWLGTQNLRKRGGLLVQDNRTTANPNRLEGQLLLTGDVTNRGHILSKDTTTNVTIAMGPAAGTTPPTPIIVGKNDTMGTVLFGTGVGAGVGALFTVTFERPYSTKVPNVQLSSGNKNTAMLDIYKAKDGNGFTVYCAGEATSSQGNTFYQIDYLIIG